MPDVSLMHFENTIISESEHPSFPVTCDESIAENAYKVLIFSTLPLIMKSLPSISGGFLKFCLNYHELHSFSSLQNPDVLLHGNQSPLFEVLPFVEPIFLL